ncbi:hypothetical protein ACFL52_03400 [Candidatus Margulisiibacteriota bacterium]
MSIFVNQNYYIPIVGLALALAPSKAKLVQQIDRAVVKAAKLKTLVKDIESEKDLKSMIARLNKLKSKVGTLKEKDIETRLMAELKRLIKIAKRYVEVKKKEAEIIVKIDKLVRIATRLKAKVKRDDLATKLTQLVQKSGGLKHSLSSRISFMDLKYYSDRVEEQIKQLEAIYYDYKKSPAKKDAISNSNLKTKIESYRETIKQTERAENGSLKTTKKTNGKKNKERLTKARLANRADGFIDSIIAAVAEKINRFKSAYYLGRIKIPSNMFSFRVQVFASTGSRKLVIKDVKATLDYRKAFNKIVKTSKGKIKADSLDRFISILKYMKVEINKPATRSGDVIVNIR